MTELGKLTYGYLEGWPTIYLGGGTGFYYANGEWKEADNKCAWDIFTKSAVLSKATFDEIFARRVPSIEAQRFVTFLEQATGRELSPQEIALALEQARAPGELSRETK